MTEMHIEYLSPDELTPYAKNAKKHPDNQVQHIANSIREFGFRQPIVVDADNVVVIGHGRLLAAKELGLDSVPVVRADDLSDEQIKALRLADNKTNESEWDFLELEGELSELELDFDMSDFGFTEAPQLLDAMGEDFGIAGNSNPMGTVTLTFGTPEEAEEVKSFIRKNDQAGILITVLNYVRGL